MRTYDFILLVFVIVLFNNSSCERDYHSLTKNNQYSLTVKNNSAETILFEYHLNAQLDSFCFKTENTTKMEFRTLVYELYVNPFSTRDFGIDFIIRKLQAEANATWTVQVFHLSDIETMPCEEFNQKPPIKKEKIFTLADFPDLETRNNWTFVYP